MPDVAGTHKVKGHPGIYWYALANGKRRYAAVATFLGEQKWTRGHRIIQDAEDAKELELRKLKRGSGAGASPRITLSEFIDEHWLPSLDIDPGSLRTYKVAANCIKASPIANRRLNLLTDNHIESFKQWMRKQEWGPTTRFFRYSILKQSLEYARRRRFIPDNPCQDIEAPAKGKHHAPVLSQANIRSLLSAAYATPYGLMVYIPIVSGLRESEVFGALWSNLDMRTGRLTVIGKGDKQRSIILDPTTIELLKRHRQKQLRDVGGIDAEAPRYLFVGRTGTPWRQSRFYDRWDRIRKDAGLSELHYHDLRHVHSTLGSQNGVPVKVMQQRLGHEDASITLNVYTDAEIEEQRPGAAAIAAAVRAAFDPLSKDLAEKE